MISQLEANRVNLKGGKSLKKAEVKFFSKKDELTPCLFVFSSSAASERLKFCFHFFEAVKIIFETLTRDQTVDKKFFLSNRSKLDSLFTQVI